MAEERGYRAIFIIAVGFIAWMFAKPGLGSGGLVVAIAAAAAAWALTGLLLQGRRADEKSGAENAED